MPRDRSYRDSAPTHPLERVVQEVAPEYCEADLGAREDRWAQSVRRDVEAKLARLRHRLVTTPGSRPDSATLAGEFHTTDGAAQLPDDDVLSPGNSRRGCS